MAGCVLRQVGDLAGVEPLQQPERGQQLLAAFFSGEGQAEEGRQKAAQVGISGAQLVQLPPLLQPLELATTLGRLVELLETDSLAHLRAHVLAVRGRSEQDIDRQQHRFHAFSRPPAYWRWRSSKAWRARRHMVVRYSSCISTR